MDAAARATQPGGSPARTSTGIEIAGEWSGLRFRVSLALAASAPAWFWHVVLENATGASCRVDLVYAQDVALATYGAVRLNEYYVSQYLDHTPLKHPSARRACSQCGRTSRSAGGTLGFASDRCATARASARTHSSFMGFPRVPAGSPAALEAERLPGVRRQHEHSMAVLQDAPLSLAAGASAALGFFAWLEPDHPGVSGAGRPRRSSIERWRCPKPCLAGMKAGAASARAATLFSDATPACRDAARSPAC